MRRLQIKQSNQSVQKQLSMKFVTAGDKGYVITTTDKEGYGGDIQITVGITSMMVQ